MSQISLISQSSDSLKTILDEDSLVAFKQVEKFADQLFNQYEEFTDAAFFKRRHKHAEILPVVEKHRANSLFEIKKYGESFEGRDIFLIKTGTGKRNILLWSQMHGDEPTATQALFDIMNFLAAEKGFEKERKAILENLCIYIIPMLNPDGAEKYKRRNAQDIDLNRDALRQATPEAQLLKKIRDEINAEYGFNLHDQGRHYAAGLTHNPATISFLAPAFNVEKEMNKNRANAMRQILVMNHILQKYIPNQVGRYNDDFMPTSMGDNIQKWGTGAILIESGGYQGDPEKQYIRKMNFIAILSALYSIAIENENFKYDAYFTIPENESYKLYDFLIRNAEVRTKNYQYIIDIGINRREIENKDYSAFEHHSTIDNIGDLSFRFGYEELDAKGLIATPCKVWNEEIKSKKELEKLDTEKLLDEGYLYVNISPKLAKKVVKKEPFILLTDSQKLPTHIKMGGKANLVLMKNDEIKYVIINGFIRGSDN